MHIGPELLYAYREAWETPVMPFWVQLTLAGDDKKEPVYVNLENATHMFSRNPGTRIFYPGDRTDYSDVVEEVGRIVVMKAVS